MIPRIANLAKPEHNYSKFFAALAQSGFQGDIDTSHAGRLLCATDNSVYQRMPQGVVFPRSKQDVVTIFKLASKPEFASLVLTPRGGGTGTNGQSLNSGVVMDMSRHMKGVSDLNVEERSVWVEAGVIKDELNELVAPYHLFFSPELSTSSRACIGGMISNDAAGQGSLKYGRTSEHILEVEVVLMDGTLTTFKPVAGAALQECLAKPGLEGEIYRACYALLKDNAAAVAEHFPKLNRFLTGYDLAHAYDAQKDELNLVRLICGAEGTLATVVRAKLDLTLQPSYRALCVIKYLDFDSALRHANVLIKAGAFSVETVDSRVLGLAQKDPVWLSVQPYIQDVPGKEIKGVNIVEFNGYDAAKEKAKLHELYQSLQESVARADIGSVGSQDAASVPASSKTKRTKSAKKVAAGAGVASASDAGATGTAAAGAAGAADAALAAGAVGAGAAGVIGAQIADTKEAIAAVYGMRKKAVGLLGSAAGRQKLVAFTEDTVVPPDNLADYIAEFRALLDGLNVTYGMFGHVDTGVMHVRPALDLTTDEDKTKLITISIKVVELVKKYGGQMWGEHGRGYRSCFGEQFFGELYPVARKVKAAFDAKNRLNPGKICVPWGNERDRLVALDDPMRGDLDRLLSEKVRTSFEGALNCNGNGQCFSYSQAALMCPSYRFSKDHVRSPKGYAGLMREWLRLLQERHFDITALEQAMHKQALQDAARTGLSGALVTLGRYLATLGPRIYHTLRDRDDFNHEYLAHISTCVSCKSCKTQCPAHVNAAELNSRFLNFYYSRYLRPGMDLLCLNTERTTPFMLRFPKLFNALLKNSLNQWFLERVLKFTDIPLFCERTLYAQARDAGIPVLKINELAARAAHFDVVVIANAFTAGYEADGLIDLAKLAKLMGFRVAILPPYTNGKLMVIRGAREQFIKCGLKQAERLAKLQAKGLTLVGFDPALTICYRDEYRALIPNCPDFTVLLPEEWLQQAITSPTFRKRESKFKEALVPLTKAHAAGAIASAASASATASASASSVGGTSTIATGHEGALPVADFSQDFYLFCHCTEQALVPLSVKMWQEVLAHFKLNLLPIPVACCGMAGLFGHIVGNQKESKDTYERHWAPKLRQRPFAQCLITGFSCRSQVLRMEAKRANHPVHVLRELLEQATKLSKQQR